jgi:hypothetical protein
MDAYEKHLSGKTGGGFDLLVIELPVTYLVGFRGSRLALFAFLQYKIKIVDS